MFSSMILLCLYSSYILYPRNRPSIIFIYCHMTYKQECTPYLYMEYISFSWSYIAELVGPIIISLIGSCCWKGSYLINGYHWLSWSHYFGNFTVTSMTWLTVTEYLCHKWPRICSICRKHFSVLCTFITYYRIRN